MAHHGAQHQWKVDHRELRFHSRRATNKRVLNTFNGKFSLNDGHVFTQRFTMRVPDGCQSLLVRVTARNNEFSDGEERTIPVLSRQIEVTRAVPFTLRRGESLQTRKPKPAAS